MSSMIQFSMNGEREIQWTRFVRKRPDLQNLGQTDAIKKVLFDVMDAEDAKDKPRGGDKKANQKTHVKKVRSAMTAVGASNKADSDVAPADTVVQSPDEDGDSK